MKPGSYDPPRITPVLWEGASGSIAWDVGCSVGNTLSEAIFRFDTVIGFEPSRVALKYLKTIPPVKGVTVFDLAISDHDGKVELDLEEGRKRVPCRSLDSLTRKLYMPDFIKVDVSGHEAKVLGGAPFIMVTKSPQWLIEVYSKENGDECLSILDRFGYKSTLIFDPDDRQPDNHYWIRATIPRLSS